MMNGDSVGLSFKEETFVHDKVSSYDYILDIGDRCFVVDNKMTQIVDFDRRMGTQV